MKHKKIFLIGLISVIIVIAVIIAVAILSNIRDNSDDIKIYFLNPATNELEYEIRQINVSDESTMLKDVISEIKLGPKSTASLVNAVPSGVEFKDCRLVKDEINGNTVYAYLEDSENELTPSSELTCKVAVVWSMTELEFVHNVVLKIDDKELGNYNRENTELNPSISPDKTERREVILYFPDEYLSSLRSERRTIDVVQSQSIETKIVQELIAGPDESGHIAVIPPETKLKNIITEDGVCYVDFSREFVERHSGGTEMERFTIYSIVNSLTELDNISKVQFLIEGQKEEEFKGYLDFSKLFERDESIIYSYVPEKKMITLYFADDADRLVEVKMEIESLENTTYEEQIIKLLIEGPKQEGCYSVIPPGTSLLGVRTKDGTCTVDLSREFMESDGRFSVNELAVYSIVNSLTELDGIEGVIFTIDGNPIDSFNRYFDFLKPIERNEDIIYNR